MKQFSLITVLTIFLSSCASTNHRNIKVSPLYLAFKKLDSCIDKSEVDQNENETQSEVKSSGNTLAQGQDKKKDMVAKKILRSLNQKACYLSYRKKYSQAIYYYELALLQKNISNKEKSIIYGNIANIFFLNAQTLIAENNLKESLRLNPENTASLIKLGIVNFQRGDFNSSVSFLIKALKHQPENQEVIYFLGVNFFLLKQKKNFITQVLRKIGEKNSDEFKLLQSAGLILRGKKVNSVASLEISSNALKLLKDYILTTYEPSRIQSHYSLL